PPIRQQPQVPQQGDFGGQDFGNPAAVRGGVDMEDPGAAQRGGERSELSDAFGTGTAFIATDGGDPDMNLLEHTVSSPLEVIAVAWGSESPPRLGRARQTSRLPSRHTGPPGRQAFAAGEKPRPRPPGAVPGYR